MFDHPDDQATSQANRFWRSEAFDDYLTQSDVPLEVHVRRKQLHLAHSISKRVKVYLDTNFWIWLRKANDGDGSEQAEQLLATLRRAVSSGTVVCPLSEGGILELFKQSDPLTLRKTAALMDELSLGVTLIEPRMRVNTEISRLVHDMTGRGPLDDLDDLVWCKVAYVLGYMHPVADWIEPQVMLALQKGVFDEAWDMPLTEMVEKMEGSQTPSFLDFESLAEKLNVGVSAHSHELKSYAQAYRAEVRGAVDLCGDVMPKIVHWIGQKEGAIPEDAAYVADQSNINAAKNMLAIALEKNKARMALRSMHIQATLHASHRWDKGRKFSANDLLDFAHATAALGYCNAFLTEGPLRTMIEQNHTGLAPLFGRKICSRIEEAVAFVTDLERLPA